MEVFSKTQRSRSDPIPSGKFGVVDDEAHGNGSFINYQRGGGMWQVGHGIVGGEFTTARATVDSFEVSQYLPLGRRKTRLWSIQN